MDRSSVIRGFEEVFGARQDEVAIRFYKLFQLGPRAYNQKTPQPAEPTGRSSEEKLVSYDLS